MDTKTRICVQADRRALPAVPVVTLPATAIGRGDLSKSRGGDGKPRAYFDEGKDGLVGLALFRPEQEVEKLSL